MKYWGATTASITGGATGEALTLEKLLAVMRSIPKPPPMPKYDIFPSLYADKAYELNTSAVLGSEDRRMIVAPMTEAWHWYTELQKLGVDVRWQPRIGDAYSSAGE